MLKAIHGQQSINVASATSAAELEQELGL